MDSYKILTKKDDSTEYKFVSSGLKGDITKFIIFEEYNQEIDLYSLALVDLMGDGSISDSSYSNNGDLRKILTTVAKVIIDYTLIFPERTIIFQGSDEDGKRNSVYNRAISSYFTLLGNEFTIKGITEENLIEEFRPAMKYTAFLVKRK